MTFHLRFLYFQSDDEIDDNEDDVGDVQSGRKCVIVASVMRAEQGPCEPIKGCIHEIRETEFCCKIIE